MQVSINEEDCKYLRRLFNKGQYWCANNHDMMHCDINCPFREVDDTSSVSSSSSLLDVPHNIYK